MTARGPALAPTRAGQIERQRFRRRLEMLEISRPIAVGGSLITAVLAIGLAIHELATTGPRAGAMAWAVLLAALMTLAAVGGLFAWRLWPRPVFVLGGVAGLSVFVWALASGPVQGGDGYAAALLAVANLWSFPLWLFPEYRLLAAHRGNVESALAASGLMARAVEPDPPAAVSDAGQGRRKSQTPGNDG